MLVSDLSPILRRLTLHAKSVEVNGDDQHPPAMVQAQGRCVGGPLSAACLFSASVARWAGLEGRTACLRPLGTEDIEEALPWSGVCLALPRSLLPLGGGPGGQVA